MDFVEGESKFGKRVKQDASLRIPKLIPSPNFRRAKRITFCIVSVGCCFPGVLKDTANKPFILVKGSHLTRIILYLWQK
jgi:hypothetical protein